MVRYLPEHVIRKRQRKNALDLVGHFGHFIGEMGQVICWCIANLTFKNSFNHLSLHFHVYQSGILALMMVVINNAIRTTAHELRLASKTSLMRQMSIALSVTVLILAIVLNV